MTKEIDFTKRDNLIQEYTYKYMEDYLLHTRGYNGNGNINCLRASKHPKGTDKNASMGLDKTTRELHCFTCDSWINIFELVKEDTGLTTDKEIQNYLDSMSYKDSSIKTNKIVQNMTITPSPVYSTKEIDKLEINTDYNFTEIINQANELVLKNDKHDSLSMLGYQYYTKRGLTEETIKRFKLGVVNNINDVLVNYDNLKVMSKKADLYKYILPLLDEQGNCYNFIGEIANRNEIDDFNAKYRKIASGTGITTQLFNEYYLKNNKLKTIFITEGIYDTLSIEQMGFNAIALIGVGATRLEQLLKYYKPNVNLVIMLDNDETGLKMGATLINKLTNLNLENINFINGIDILKDYEKIATCKDANDMLLKDSKTFKDFLIANYKLVNANEDTQRLDNADVVNSLNYFRNIENEPINILIKTGMDTLDKNLKGGLRKALYILGAISNLGKTAFLLQLADQIASLGQPVLYFSLEMEKNELIARSIARTTYKQVGDKTDKNNIPLASTTFDILDNFNYKNYSNDKKKIINTCIDIYENVAKNLHIVSGFYKDKREERRYTINDIVKVVNDYVKYYEKTPVIFLDYIQILAPTDKTMTDKQNIDECVLKLKQLSNELETPIIAISSYNRDNYYEPANVSAFKESGSIEYGADYIFALQYEGIDNIYYGTKLNSKGNSVPIYATESEKKRAVYDLIESYNKDSKENGTPIPIQLKLLKSRNSSKFNMTFKLKARYGYFKEDTEDFIIDNIEIPRVKAKVL